MSASEVLSLLKHVKRQNQSIGFSISQNNIILNFFAEFFLKLLLYDLVIFLLLK
jgi:hypothetical protein